MPKSCSTRCGTTFCSAEGWEKRRPDPMIPKQRIMSDGLVLCIRVVWCRFTLPQSLHRLVRLPHERFCAFESKLTFVERAGAVESDPGTFVVRAGTAEPSRNTTWPLKSKRRRVRISTRYRKMKAGNVHCGFPRREVVASIPSRTLAQPRNKREMCLFDSCSNRRIQLNRQHSEQRCERRD
jgi:hypothetical protein